MPEPIITSRDTWNAWDEYWYPSSPRKLVKDARLFGWDVRMGFSRGYVPGQALDSWEIRDIIGVWLDGYGQRAAAFWERNPDAEFSSRKVAPVRPGEIPSGAQWKPSGTIIMLGKGLSFPYATLTQFHEWVLIKGDVGQSWYHEIRSTVLFAREQAAILAKQRAERDKRMKEQAAQARAREEAKDD